MRNTDRQAEIRGHLCRRPGRAPGQPRPSTRLRAWAVALGFLLSLAVPASAQRLNEKCTAGIQNRTVQVSPNGTFAIPNVPEDPGLYRVRVVCKQDDGTVTGGQSELIQLTGPGRTFEIKGVALGAVQPPPVSVEISASTNTLTTAGENLGLAVLGTMPDGSIRDMTTRVTGTTYATSNPRIAVVSEDGVVTAVARGQVIISARNEGTLGSITIDVLIPDDADADGMTDEFERLNGLDPNNGADAAEDPDSDGLTSLQEFTLNTNPRSADTDGDALRDGDEIAHGTDPLRADADGDGLPDGQEVALGTNPLAADTDADGIGDGLELRLNLNPLTADQTTTVQGFVRDAAGAPAAGASAIAFNFFTATADASGFFQIQGVPASLGPVIVLAQAVRNGQVFAGSSGAVPALGGGTTDVGVIQIVLDSGTVSGLVTDVQNRPVVGAQVRVVVGADVRAASTDLTGRYRVSGLASGPITVTARDPQTNLRGRATGVLAPNLSATVDVRLGPSGTLTGTILGRDGATPVGVGAMVRLSGPASLTATTNALGGYQFDYVPLGAYTVEASDAAGNRGRGSATVSATGQVAVANVTYLGQGTVSGLVKDGAGSPVAGASVTLNSRSIFGGAFNATSGADGRYTIGGVFIGQYDVSARATVARLGGQASGRIDVDAQQVTTDIMVVASGSLTGLVTRAGGAPPVAGAEVRLTPTGLAAVTDAQGQYRFDFLPLGTYTVDATDPATGDRGRASGAISAQDEVRTLNVALRGQGQVVVAVRDGADAPVGGAEVTLISQTEFGGTQSAVTAPDGTATFARVLAGNFSVSAADPQTQLGGSANGTVAAGGTTSVTVQLQRAGTILGTVRTAAGSPAPGLTLEVEGPVSRQTASGSDGSFQFPFLPTGTYTLEARDSLGNLRAQNGGVTITSQGEQVTSDVTLIGVGTVAGRVTNPNGTPAQNITVSLESDAFGFAQPLTTRTGVDGNYSIPQVPIGPFTATASVRVGEQQFAGQAAGQVTTDGEAVTADIQLVVSLVPTTHTFFDSSNFTYDLQSNGSVQDGTTAVFRGDGGANRGGLLLDIVSNNTVMRFTGQALGSPQLGGRQIVIQQENIAGLDVTRKMYVPRQGYFARYLEILTNPTGLPITVDVRVTTNFRFIRKVQGGATFDREPRVVSTSSGDAVLDIGDPNARDRWVTFDDDEDLDPFTVTNNLPSVAHVFDGTGGAQQTGRAQFTLDFGALYGQLTEEWQGITVEPGASVAFLHFTSEQTDRAAAQASAERLVQLPPEALVGLSPAELSQIRNFAAPANGLSTVEPLPALDGTVSGRVLAADNTTAIPGAPVTFRSAHPIFARTYTFNANGAGQFSRAAAFNDTGTSVTIPQTAFVLRATHPLTGLVSPATQGFFQQGLLTAMQDVVFTNSGILNGVVRRTQDTVVSSGTVRVSGGALPSPATVPIAGDGSFTVSALAGGSYTLSVSVPHPQGSALTASAAAQVSEGQTSFADITLPPTGAVAGVVRRGTSEVVVDLPVELRAAGFTRSTRTDTSGAFNFPDVPVGAYTLEAFEQATNIAASAQVSVAANQTTQQDLNLVPGGSVSGLVTNAGQPVAGAQVSLAAVNGNFSTTTGGDGRYSFDPVALGAFTVTALDPATSLRGRTTGTVSTSGQTVTANIQLVATGAVTGTVFRADGTTPAPGLPVSVFNDTFFGSLIGSATTDAQGRYTVDFVPAGSFRVEVSDPATGDRGRATNQLNTNGEIRTVNVTLNGLGTVVVTVRDNFGNLAAGAQVRVTSNTQFGGTLTATSQPDGTATFAPVLAGPFTVVATDPATNLSGSATGTLAVGGTANVPVMLQPSGTIRGRVFDVDGTTPLPDVRVRLLNNNIFFNVEREVRTAADGSYSFEAVPLATRHVDARDDAGRVRARVNNLTLTTNAQVITQDLTFVGLGTVTGQVFNPNDTLAPGVSVTVQSNNPQVGGSFNTTTNSQGEYTVANVPTGSFIATATNSAQQLRGETTGQVAQHQQTVRADIRLLNNGINLPVNAWDASNFLFNLQRNGSIFDGTNNVYRGDFNLNQGAFLLDIIVGGTATRFNGGTIGTTEDAGREVAIRQQNIAGLDITRKFFIPRDGYFVRYLETISNPTAAPITLDLRVQSNFRQFSGLPRVITTSSGDAALSVADPTNPDRWVVVDDGSDTDPFESGGVPATTFVFDGAGGAQRAGAVSFTAPSHGQLNYQWNNITVAPGETVTYLHFGVQQVSRAAAQVSAERLVQLPPEALSGLSPAELTQIRNFAAPPDGLSTVAPLPALGGRITGRLLAGDNTTPIPSGQVRFRSSLPFYGRLQTVTTTAEGGFTFATAFNTAGNSLVIPVAPFTLFSNHPQTGLRSPDFMGAFGEGQTEASRDVTFTNTGLVRGTVRRHTGALVTSGSVSISGPNSASTSIGPDGSYAFSGLNPGNYTATAFVSSPQGSSLTGTASVIVTAGQASVANITMQATGTVTGTVRTSAGALAPNVLVRVRTSGFSFFRDATTDATGRFTHPDVPVGSYIIEAFDPVTSIPTTAPVSVLQDQTTQIDLTLIGRGQVQVQVNFFNGTPAVGSSVQIREAARGSFLSRGTTDSAGRLLVSNVGVGDFTVRAFRPQSSEIFGEAMSTLAEGQTQNVTVTLPATATVRVTVLRADGTPFAGARVDIRHSFRTSFGFAGNADANGVISIPNVPAGSFVVRALVPNTSTSAGSASGVVTAADDNQIVDITINAPNAGNVRGTIVAADGQTPVIGANVQFFDLASGTFLRSAAADSQGFYQVTNIVPDSGSARLVVFSPNDSTVRVEDVVSFATSGETLTRDYTLAASVVRGSVFYSGNTERVPFARVFATQTDATTGLDRTLFATADANGDYRIYGIRVGPFVLMGQDRNSALEGMASGAVADLTVPVTVDVTLAPSGVVTGTVTDAAGAVVPEAEMALTSPGLAFETYTTADNQGVYNFPHVALGPFFVQAAEPVSFNIFGSANGTVATEGQVVTLDIALPAAGTVLGTVFQADGVTPVPNARVFIENYTHAGPNFYSWTSVRADSLGNYQATGVQTGEVRVTATAPSDFRIVGITRGTLTASAPATINVSFGNAFAFGVYNLDGADGFRYDVECDGELGDGGTIDRTLNDAYDGAYFLKINQQYAFCTDTATLEDGGREAIIESGLNGLLVTRKVFSPESGGFARYLDTLTNPGTTAQTFTLEIENDLGSDSATRIVTAPSVTGNTYAVTDQGGSCCDPVLAHVFSGTNPSVPVASTMFREGNTVVFYRWTVTVQPGQTITLMHFAVQRLINDTAGAAAQAEALVNLTDPHALDGMSAEEKARVINFSIPPQ